MSPLHFLATMLIVTAAAQLAYAVRQRAHRARIYELARDWQMHFSAHDRFDLAARVALCFPVPGVSELRVFDLVYGSEGDSYRYLFSVDYTVGVTHAKHRVRRVVSFREPKGRTTVADWSPLVLAPAELPTLAQYRALRAQTSATSPARSNT